MTGHHRSIRDRYVRNPSRHGGVGYLVRGITPAVPPLCLASSLAWPPVTDLGSLCAKPGAMPRSRAQHPTKVIAADLRLVRTDN